MRLHDRYKGCVSPRTSFLAVELHDERLPEEGLGLPVLMLTGHIHRVGPVWSGEEVQKKEKCYGGFNQQQRNNPE